MPSREAQDELVESLPAYFEANDIHIAGLITASYAGEEFSHYLAKSSLGTWLREQGVPAIYGVDTRALTKKIRLQGSMLGKLMLQKARGTVGERLTNGINHLVRKGVREGDWHDDFEHVEWVDPNVKNLVAEGNHQSQRFVAGTANLIYKSFDPRAQNLFSTGCDSIKAAGRQPYTDLVYRCGYEV